MKWPVAHLLPFPFPSSFSLTPLSFPKIPTLMTICKTLQMSMGSSYCFPLGEPPARLPVYSIKKTTHLLSFTFRLYLLKITQVLYKNLLKFNFDTVSFEHKLFYFVVKKITILTNFILIFLQYF